MIHVTAVVSQSVAGMIPVAIFVMQFPAVVKQMGIGVSPLGIVVATAAAGEGYTGMVVVRVGGRPLPAPD